MNVGLRLEEHGTGCIALWMYIRMQDCLVTFTKTVDDTTNLDLEMAT